MVFRMIKTALGVLLLVLGMCLMLSEHLTLVRALGGFFLYVAGSGFIIYSVPWRNR